MANTRTSRKVAIVGVGGVGMGCAYSILNQGLVDEMVKVNFRELLMVRRSRSSFPFVP